MPHALELQQPAMHAMFPQRSHETLCGRDCHDLVPRAMDHISRGRVRSAAHLRHWADGGDALGGGALEQGFSSFVAGGGSNTAGKRGA